MKLTKEEKQFRRDADGAPVDDDELAAMAAKVPGSLGMAAKFYLYARDQFQEELKRIGLEEG